MEDDIALLSQVQEDSDDDVGEDELEAPAPW